MLMRSVRRSRLVESKLNKIYGVTMIDKLVLTVTPIFSIPPRGAAAVEIWMYQVARRTKTTKQNRLY